MGDLRSAGRTRQGEGNVLLPRFHQEALHEDALLHHTQLPQRRFDEIHEGAGPTDVEVGVELAPDESGDVRGGEEPAVGVDMVAHPEPGAVPPAQPGERILEDDRRPVTVGVEQSHRPLRGREHVLGNRHHRGDPATPAQTDHPTVGLLRAEDAGRLGELEHVTLRDMVEEPIGDEAAGHPLDGDGQVAVRLRGTRHGVRAQVLPAVDVHPERAELPGPVAERRLQPLGYVEHEGARVTRFGNDRPDAQRVVAVLAQDWVVVSHCPNLSPGV